MPHFRVALFMVLGIATTGAVAQELSLADRVQRVQDRQQIYALQMEYGRAISGRNAPALARLFAREGVWKGNVGEAKGPAEIQKMLDITIGKIAPGQEHRGGFHIMSNIEIDLQGDTANCKSRWMWVIPSPTGYPVGQRSGYFEDKLVREDGVWRFAYRLTVTQLPLEQHDEEKNIWRSDFRDAAPAKN
jgi:hypothetical protein